MCSYVVVFNLFLFLKVFKLVNIVWFGLENVNMIFIGFVIEKIILVFVELLMDDGLSYLINNFISYSGLLLFFLSNFGLVKIDVLFGVVILVVDSSSCVIIMVSFIVNVSVIVEFVFYCNLELKVGEVDIGEREGLFILMFDKDDIWKMFIRVNFGFMGILVV